jgi:hypothetical protein
MIVEMPFASMIDFRSAANPIVARGEVGRTPLRKRCDKSADLPERRSVKLPSAHAAAAVLSCAPR